MRGLKYLAGLAVTNLAFTAVAVAQEAAAQAASNALITTDGMKAFGLGIAVLGGALGQSKAVAAAVESIGRNPGAAGEIKMPALLALFLIESLVVLCWLYAAILK